MQIRLAADLQPDSVVDGEGVRTVLWTQGCPHAKDVIIHKLIVLMVEH